jgi:probable H4MPT-linked C1 transfer pathway protein
MPPSVLGLDVGGANLKMAHAGGLAVTRPFALWKHPQRLAAALAELVHAAPPHDRIAVTMTGELCDCFTTKREGVAFILDAVEEAAGHKPVIVWTTSAEFIAPAEARREWLRVAAANWLATAMWAGSYVDEGPALFVDAGSTTTDFVPLWHGRPMPLGLNDPDRLKTGELLYTGARRTPVCSLMNGEGMAELFATTLDAHVLLGNRPEAPDDCDTADGRPATKEFAHARLSRMLGGDPEMTPPEATLELAARVAARQADMIRAAARMVAARLPQGPAVLVTAGSGEFLSGAITDPNHGWSDLRTLSLSETLGPEVSHAAAAYAVAMLAAEFED